MKMIVTGGAGFIGSNFIHYMLAKYPDLKVLNFDKLTYAGNLDNLKDIENDPRYKFQKGDICNPEDVNGAVCRMEADVIINFAAESHVDRSIQSAGEFVTTDVYGTYVLLEAVKKYRIPKYIHISTDEVYGSIQKGKFKEEDTLKPNSPYAASKAGADLLVRSYVKTWNIPAIITRSSNNFGPYQYPEKVIPLFITNLLSGKKVPLYGDGKNVRDWIYVEDNCSGLDAVIQKGKMGEIYNIGGGNEKQNIEITKLILKELKKGEDMIQPVADRLGHDRRYALDSSKVEALGWKPKHNFEQALAKTVKWYSANQDWWKKLV